MRARLAGYLVVALTACAAGTGAEAPGQDTDDVTRVDAGGAVEAGASGADASASQGHDAGAQTGRDAGGARDAGEADGNPGTGDAGQGATDSGAPGLDAGEPDAGHADAGAIDPDAAELALRWAPIHYQDVDQTGDHALGGRADYITRIDFDGTDDVRDNWENAGGANASFAAYAYYAVVSTSSHWYITYLFFHPRDWSDGGFDSEHENDAEGLLAAIERDGSRHGTLRAVVTVAHTNFFSFTPFDSTWRAGREDLDGTLTMQEYAGAQHPVTAQEAKGHGLKAYPYYQIDGGDGLVYVPSGQAETPSDANDRDVGYALVDMLAPGGLWERRNDGALFASFGSFAGNDGGGCGAGTRTCTDNAAHAPWGWDDEDDAPGVGELATDPAKVVSEYFTIPEPLARTYEVNPFRP